MMGSQHKYLSDFTLRRHQAVGYLSCDALFCSSGIWFPPCLPSPATWYNWEPQGFVNRLFFRFLTLLTSASLLLFFLTCIVLILAVRKPEFSFLTRFSAHVSSQVRITAHGPARGSPATWPCAWHPAASSTAPCATLGRARRPTSACTSKASNTRARCQSSGTAARWRTWATLREDCEGRSCR